jgi:iron complex transport system substrate-binding protein
VLKNKYFERPSGRITELLTEIAKAFPTEKPETASSKTESTNNKESNKENSKETENSKPEPVSSDVSE